MKRKHKIQAIITIACILLFGGRSLAQDSTKHPLVVSVGYYANNNQLMYLLVHTKTKVNKKFRPVSDYPVSLYIDSVAGNCLVAKVKTDETGIGKAFLPVSLKSIWDGSSEHHFIAVTESGKEFNETNTDISITKSKIELDTISDSDTRKIKVKVYALKNGSWIPAKDVEMKVGINRLGGILSAGSADTYTTDSTGSAVVDYKRDSLPGDQAGNLVLVAKVEDNDIYGNMLIEKTVPWGIATKIRNDFFSQRTLWSTRFRTPFWLLGMAYFIVAIVWGTMIYLIFQLVKIKKLGKQV